MTGILILIVAITLAVGIHEYGHYLACRALGIPVDKFAIGFGTPLLKRTSRSGTEWSIRPILLGGFVQPEESAMGEASPLAKFIVAIAGPAANLVPFMAIAAAMGKLGFFVSFLMNAYLMSMVALFNVVTFGVFAAAAEPEGALMGPIGLAASSASHTATSGSFVTFIALFFILSIGLGLINLVPIPVLDGGRAVMAGVEAGIGRVRAARIERVANVIGILLIVMIVISVAITDIGNLFG
jgi:regulator of sigma E protease